jgi:hypothetical protein
VNPEGRCDDYAEAAHQVFQEGCVKKLKELLSGIGLLLGILAVAVGVIEVCTAYSRLLGT